MVKKNKEPAPIYGADSPEARRKYGKSKGLTDREINMYERRKLRRSKKGKK